MGEKLQIIEERKNYSKEGRFYFTSIHSVFFNIIIRKT